MRNIPILQWKTVIRDLSPISGETYMAHRSALAAWPRLQPLVIHEALNVARARCECYGMAGP